MNNASPQLQPGSINFVWLPGKTYARVQDQIFSLLEEHLPPKSVVYSVDDAVEGTVSLSLFIRQGREHNSSRVPADIVMAHGIADKRYFFIQESETNLPLANQYDYVFVPGQWHINRLIEGTYRRNPHYQITLRQDQMVKVGWLRLDPLIEEAKVIDKEPHHRLRILWAPTHNVVKGDSDEITPSSFPGFKPHVKQMAARYIFRVSLHPRNRTDKQPTGNQLVWSDVVVSDFGTMVYEAWALGKPVIFPRWCIDVETLITRNPLSAEAYIYKNKIGLHPETYEEMVAMLDDIQSHLIGNPLTRMVKRVIRLKLRRKSGPDLRGPGVATFIDHYVDPESRGSDAKRTADELIRIALDRGLGAN